MNQKVGYKQIMIKRSIIISTIISVSILFILRATPGYTGKVKRVIKDIIKIGFITDLTGPAAANCIPLRDGLRSSFRYINHQDGINGKVIRFLVEDDHYSIHQSMAALKKLVYKDKVLYLNYFKKLLSLVNKNY